MDRDYFGAVISSVELGPRRELTLNFDIWPKHNTATDGSGSLRCTIRFGGISNYEEIAQTLKDINTFESILYLRDAPASKVTRRVVDMEFDRTGQRIRIVASHVQEQ